MGPEGLHNRKTGTVKPLTSLEELFNDYENIEKVRAFADDLIDQIVSSAEVGGNDPDLRQLSTAERIAFRAITRDYEDYIHKGHLLPTPIFVSEDIIYIIVRGDLDELLDPEWLSQNEAFIKILAYDNKAA